MKISNFRMKELLGKGPLDWFAVADVDVETGAFLWRKKETKEIAQKFTDFEWVFTETGKVAVCREAIKAWEANNRKSIWDFK